MLQVLQVQVVRKKRLDCKLTMAALTCPNREMRKMSNNCRRTSGNLGTWTSFPVEGPSAELSALTPMRWSKPQRFCLHCLLDRFAFLVVFSDFLASNYFTGTKEIEISFSSLFRDSHQRTRQINQKHQDWADDFWFNTNYTLPESYNSKNIFIISCRSPRLGTFFIFIYTFRREW